MDTFELPIQIRWADLDPNFHLRHTIYMDWGAMCRMDLLVQSGLSLDKLAELRLGPILLREECVYRREIRMGDQVTINLKVAKAKRDFGRWSVQHEIKKQANTLAATLSVDLAWLSGINRKLTVLPPEYQKILENLPKTDDFQWLD